MKFLLSAILFCVLTSVSYAQTTFKAVATWDVVTQSVTGLPITGVQYNLYRATDNLGANEIKLNSTPISALTFIDTTGNIATTYWYRLSSVYNNNESAKTAFIRFNFSDAIPGVPTNFKVLP